MLKRIVAIIFTILFMSFCIAIVVSAANTTPINEREITEAIMAADVCADHLAHDCQLCDGDRASYHEECTVCGTTMILCCSGVVKENDYYAPCYVNTHPKTCQTVQDHVWNAYFCQECGNYKRGGQDPAHDDDFHVESYWHTQATCFNHTHCTRPRLADLIDAYNAAHGYKSSGTTVNENESTMKSEQEIYNEAVLAGDWCEIHKTFGCEIPHNGLN